MRDFLLNSEEFLDTKALEAMNSGKVANVLPCKIVKWNSMIQVVYFTEELVSLYEVFKEVTLEEACEIGIRLVECMENIERDPNLSPENVAWDPDCIYLDINHDVNLICLPNVLSEEVLESWMYVKRIYALLNEMFARIDGGFAICGQIDRCQDSAEGDWEKLKHILNGGITPSAEGGLMLRSVNTPDNYEFLIESGEFRIGSDPVMCDGCIYGSSLVAPLHAVIASNDINYYVMDMGSPGGTYVNDLAITSRTPVPIGEGSVVRFGDCTFTVE